LNEEFLMRRLRMFGVAWALALFTLLAVVTVAAARTAPLSTAPSLAVTTPRETFPVIDLPEVTAAIAYLEDMQRDDGGFEGFTPGQSDDFTTIKAALALNAARLPIDTLTSAADQTALDFLENRAYSYTHDLDGVPFPGRLGLLILAVAAGDATPTAFAAYPTGHPQAGQPINLLSTITDTFQPATGAYSTTASLGFSSGAAGSLSQSFVLLGLAAAATPAPPAAVQFLTDLQEPDGGWGFGFGGDVDTTAVVIQALLAQGVAPTDAAVQDGLAFLRSQQLPGGAWGFQGTASADATAFVIQAAVAAGFMPPTASWATATGDPLAALRALQEPDGSFGGNALGTAHAIAGLAQAPLPLASRSLRVERALAYVADTQAASGGWAFFGSPSVGGSLDAVLAFSAAGYNPASVNVSGASALDFLSAEIFSYTRDITGTLFPAQTGKAILALAGAGADPEAFDANPGGTLDLVAELAATYDPVTGAYRTTAEQGFSSGAPTPISQSLAILGLAAAGAPIPAEAVTYLVSLQGENGAWGSVDTTGLALQALRAGGLAADSPAIQQAIAFLRAQQDEQGGWGNPNSTAYAMQGLIAAGEDLVADWRKGGRSPFEALTLFQKPDGPFTYTWEEGSFFTPGVINDLATWQAIPALLGRAYPLVNTTPIADFTPVRRGPNPDRIVALAPSGRWGNSITVSVPFGSDLNNNGSVTLEWRRAGETAWQTATLTRGAGVFTATLTTEGPPQSYELRATFSDPDGVQAGTTLGPTAVLTATVEPLRLYLPMAAR
jgi:hypothetical protein